MSSINTGFYQNQQYEKFVRVARTDTQAGRGDQEYQQAQQMLAGDAPVAFLAQSVSWHLLRAYVRGVTTSPVDEWPGAVNPTLISIAPHRGVFTALVCSHPTRRPLGPPGGRPPALGG